MDISNLTPEQPGKVAACAIWDEDAYRVVYCCNMGMRVPDGVSSVVCPVCGAYIGVVS